MAQRQSPPLHNHGYTHDCPYESGSCTAGMPAKVACCTTFLSAGCVSALQSQEQQWLLDGLHSAGTALRAEVLVILIAQVAGGYRRPLPEYLPEALRQIITECWAQNSGQRPNISDVVDRLTALRKPRQPTVANGASREEKSTPAQQKACCVVM